MEKDLSGQLRPEDGYEWSDSNHVIVRWVPGKISREHPHLIATTTEGGWRPEDGYDWSEPANVNSKSVKWMPGTASNRYPNIVTATTESQWRPADGYAWLLNPPRSGDMKVKPVSSPQDQLSTLIRENLLQQGLSDRTEWEQWIVAQSGDFRRGAEWWAGRRSLPNPGSCNGSPAASQDSVFGCEAAKARLTPLDGQRKSNSEYRRGWNSYTGEIKPPSAADVQAAPVEQNRVVTSPDPETGSAARLNAQELMQLKGR